jgi:hypothetical protein
MARRLGIARRLHRSCRRLAGSALALFVALGLGPSAQAQSWDGPAARQLAERASVRRADPEGAFGLVAWSAKAKGRLAFLGQFGDTALMRPLLVKAAQIAVEVSWQAPGISRQRVVGLRDTALAPGDIGFYRDRYGIVQGNFPDLIRLGDGRDVRDITHPFSSAGLSRYRFAIADSLRLDTGREQIEVVRVAFRPVLDDDALAVGAAYLDRGTAEIVRLELTFTPAAILDKRIERLSVVLENGLVEGRYWLPRRQEVEVQRVATWIDIPARGIVRGRWSVSDYTVVARRDSAAVAALPAPSPGPELVFARPDSLARYPFDGPVLDPLQTEVLVAGADAVRDVRRIAEAALLRKLVPPQPRVRASALRVSDFARVTRVEGLALGGGGTLRLIGTSSVRAWARYGIADARWKGGGELTVPLPVAGPLALRASRDFRDAGDVTERSLIVNSFVAQEFGEDLTQPVESRTLGARLTLGRWADTRWSLDATWGRELPLAVNARPVTGRFNPTLPALDSRGTSVSLLAEGAPWRVTESQTATARAELRYVDQTSTLGVSRGWRGTASLAYTAALGSGTLVSNTFIGGASRGIRGLPQQQVLLGGPVSAPGYGYHTLSSDIAGFQRLEWRRDVRFVSIPLASWGRLPGVATAAPFVHAAWVNRATAFGSPRAGWYPSVGLGWELAGGLVRADVARALRGGGWYVGIDVGRVFWGLL